jgi:hypothetical protein
MAFLPIFASNALLSALSISNLGLISSMVGFLHDQKDHVGAYQVNWPGNTVQLKVEPKHLWVDQGHESNGVAGYGFFLGLFGLYVAWRQRRREGKVGCPHVSVVVYLTLTVRLGSIKDTTSALHSPATRSLVHSFRPNIRLCSYEPNQRPKHLA